MPDGKWHATFDVSAGAVGGTALVKCYIRDNSNLADFVDSTAQATLATTTYGSLSGQFWMTTTGGPTSVNLRCDYTGAASFVATKRPTLVFTPVTAIHP